MERPEPEGAKHAADRKQPASLVLQWRKAIAQSGLPRSAKTVAWALANYMNERGRSAFPGVPRLRRDVGNDAGDGPASKRLVIDALAELCRAGYLTKERDGGDGRGKTASYSARFPEAVQSQHPLAAGERVQSQHERVQSATVKGAVTAPEVEVLEVDQEVETAAAARASGHAAAADLDLLLEELKIAGPLSEQAIADPDRALAWIEVAKAEARRPAGFFRKCFEMGDWPTPRIDETAAKPGRRLEASMRSVKNLVELGMLDPDEIRYMIDVEWETLSSDERSELHEYLEQLLSGGARRVA